MISFTLGHIPRRLSVAKTEFGTTLQAVRGFGTYTPQDLPNQCVTTPLIMMPPTSTQRQETLGLYRLGRSPMRLRDGVAA